MSLLVEIYIEQTGSILDDPIEMMAEARQVMIDDPSLASHAAASLAERDHPLEPDFLKAVGTIRFQKWAYLYDLPTRSVFMDMDVDEAYGVLGVTQPIRELIGGTAAIIEGGLMEYRRRYVFDGLVTSRVWIGPNMMVGLVEDFERIKEEGRYHTRCTGSTIRPSDPSGEREVERPNKGE
jgi:hypothetical protein